MERYRHKLLYVFKLEEELSRIGQDAGWKFVQQQMTLDFGWIDNPVTRAKTRLSIDHEGVFTMAYVENDTYNGRSMVSVTIQSQMVQQFEKEDKIEKEITSKAQDKRLDTSVASMRVNRSYSRVVADNSFNSVRQSRSSGATLDKVMPDENNLNEITFEVEFDAAHRQEKVNVLNRKINKINYRQSLGIADYTDEWKLGQLE